jgi:polar amino acid transport system substrate-binding protein
MNSRMHPQGLQCSSTGMNRRRTVAGLLALGLPWAGQPAGAQTELTDLARIRASGVLKVAVYKDNAPFSSGPAGDMKGLDIALAEALARELKLKLALLPFDAGENMGDDLRNMVWRGHYLGYGPADVMLHVPVDKHLIQQTRQALIFAPYMRQVQVLVHDTRVLSQVQAAEDLKGHKLGAERGTGLASALLGYSSGALRNEVSLYPSGIDAAAAVLRGEVAAAYVLRSQAEAALAGSAAKPAHVALSALPMNGVPANGWPLGLAIKADHKDLGQALEAALKSLREQGTLVAIFQKQGLTLTAP